MTEVLAFAGVVVLGAMSPGPDFAVVMRRSAVAGRRHGMVAAAGVAIGVFGWVVAAAIGIAALLAASAVAFTVVKVVGAAYLFYLGLKALRVAARGDGGMAESVASEPSGASRAFVEGLLTNAINPKAAMFFIALVPQFLSEAEPALSQTLLMALAAALGAGLWFVVLANVVGALRRVFARAKVRRTIEGITGAALVALGVRVAALSSS